MFKEVTVQEVQAASADLEQKKNDSVFGFLLHVLTLKRAIEVELVKLDGGDATKSDPGTFAAGVALGLQIAANRSEKVGA